MDLPVNADTARHLHRTPACSAVPCGRPSCSLSDAALPQGGALTALGRWVVQAWGALPACAGPPGVAVFYFQRLVRPPPVLLRGGCEAGLPSSWSHEGRLPSARQVPRGPRGRPRSSVHPAVPAPLRVSVKNMSFSLARGAGVQSPRAACRRLRGVSVLLQGGPPPPHVTSSERPSFLRAGPPSAPPLPPDPAGGGAWPAAGTWLSVLFVSGVLALVLAARQTASARPRGLCVFPSRA